MSTNDTSETRVQENKKRGYGAPSSPILRTMKTPSREEALQVTTPTGVKRKNTMTPAENPANKKRKIASPTVRPSPMPLTPSKPQQLKSPQGEAELPLMPQTLIRAQLLLIMQRCNNLIPALQRSNYDSLYSLLVRQGAYDLSMRLRCLRVMLQKAQVSKRAAVAKMQQSLDLAKENALGDSVVASMQQAVLEAAEAAEDHGNAIERDLECLDQLEKELDHAEAECET